MTRSLSVPLVNAAVDVGRRHVPEEIISKICDGVADRAHVLRDLIKHDASGYGHHHAAEE